NQPHLFSALDAYLQIFAASNAVSGNPTGELAKQTKKYVDDLLQSKFKTLYSKLEASIADASESVKASKAVDLMSLKDYIEALMDSYSLGGGTEAATVNPSNVDFNQLIEEQNKKDSVVQP
ncbi:MAG TPA: hypothetical protein PKN22_03025, partial [Taishania sp.]|nr:hypothetical protein [Taishania sp.]